MRYENTKKYKALSKACTSSLALTGISIVIAFITFFVGAMMENSVICSISAFFFLIFILCIVSDVVLHTIRSNEMEKDILKNPEKYFYERPYKAELASVTPEINVLTDLSKTENIERAKKNKVMDVFVQETYIDDAYREIVTGKILYKDSCNQLIGLRDIDSYSVTSENLDKYIKSHSNGKYKDNMTFAQYLDHLKQRAEEYYNKSAKDNNQSEDAKISKILEDYQSHQGERMTASKRNDSSEKVYCDALTPAQNETLDQILNVYKREADKYLRKGYKGMRRHFRSMFK